MLLHTLWSIQRVCLRAELEAMLEQAQRLFHGDHDRLEKGV